MSLEEDSVELHRKLKGKISIKGNTPLKTVRDLSLLYTPGVAEPCRRIAKNKEDLGTMVLRTKEGEEIIWMYHNMVVTDEKGQSYVMSTAMNITERTSLEKDLVHTKKLMEQTKTLEGQLKETQETKTRLQKENRLQLK